MESNRRFSLRFILLTGTALILLGMQVVASFSNTRSPLQTLEFGARDTMMRVRGVQPVSGDVVVIAIDDLSLKWVGLQWPWPRAKLAEIVTKLNEAGAKVVGLDILFFEASADPSGDEALARALDESQNAVTVMQIFRQPGTVTLNLPRPILNSLDGMGITSIKSDVDAITRSLQAYDTFGEDVYFNWAFEIARLYLGVDTPTDWTSTGLTFNGQTVPLQRGDLIVDMAGPAGTIPTYSATALLEGDVLAQNPDALRGKIVLVGLTSITLKDVFPTPFSAKSPTPGVEIVANAVEMMIHGSYLRESPPWVGLLAILLAAILAAVISRLQRPSLTLALLGLAMALYALAGYLTFRFARLYLPMIGPQLMLFLGVLLPTIEQAVSQELEKRRVRNLFTRFISPEMVDQLIATQDINSLNKRANVSILFSDIRGFTTLSEKLAPEEVVALLNPYLEAMTGVIYQHGGTVDKYEGDAIIAFFGEPVSYPDHARRAVRAAVDMRTALDELKARWEREGSPRPNLEMGIGVHSGEVFVGLLGSAQRINYTVIGDAANLASRLQDLTKTYQWPILISESTQRQVQEEFETEFVDSVVVKGKTEPVNTYKVTGRKGAEPIKGWK
ncbi:MAG: CHASE2 domain-containing protein [Chloroflexota bacterium]